jgi:hypothetical protein
MRWAGHVAGMGVMKMHTKFWLDNVKGRGPSEDIGLHGRIILERILGEYGVEVVDWIYLRENRDQRRAVVNTVMNCGFHE